MSNNNYNNNSNSGNVSDAIEAKMQTLQASLRQDRDKARRDSELAMERLALLRTEVTSLENAVQERQKQLAAITQETESLQAKAGPLRETVARLTQEADYQHAEIVAKREKRQQEERLGTAAANKRQKTLRDVTKLVTDRRMHIDKYETSMLDPVAKDALQDELQDDIIRDRFTIHDWLAFVQKKQEMYENEAARMQQQTIPALERIVDRYTEQFGHGKTKTKNGAEADASTAVESE